MTTTTDDKRAEYTAGLRALADLLDEHPDLPLPHVGSTDPFDWWLFGDNPKATLATLVRLIPGAKKKQVGEHSGSSWFTVATRLHGLHIDINATRAAVCERVVTATREVTKEVPDPDVLATVPTVTITETVEDVEWVCAPLLDDEPVPA